jgi:hypothetical protein
VFAEIKIRNEHGFLRFAHSKGRVVANVWRVPLFPDRLATRSDARQLIFDEAYIERMDVSLDGEGLVVSSDRSGTDLWLLPAEGGPYGG